MNYKNMEFSKRRNKINSNRKTAIIVEVLFITATVAGALSEFYL